MQLYHNRAYVFVCEHIFTTDTYTFILQPSCSLHFHMGSSTDYRRLSLGVYSRDSAPGIIVAHGE